jgi:raffinose/stachyose/melibiose transport system substrate-binding protein
MRPLRRTVSAALATFLLTAAGACSSGSADGNVTLSLLIDNSPAVVEQAKAVVTAFEKANPTIKVETETRPGGSEGDNVVKTRLSTGDMSDVFWYNSGSLLQALNPAQTLLDLTGDPILAQVQKSYLPVVSVADKVYGVPAGTAFGGGILYNRKVYEQLGLQIPKVWAAFLANNDKVKAANLTPVVATYKDTWTSQLLVLADYYNVQAATPSFAQDFTANKATFAATPAASAGFQHLAEMNAKGYLNKGFGSATMDEGLKLLITGKAAHYPMLTMVLPPTLADNPQAATDIGFFALPGQDAAKNGATVWEPNAAYAAKTTEHPDQVKKFLGFLASPAAADAMNSASAPAGPYRIEGAKLPDNAMQAAKDLQTYIDSGASSPALEFLSPVKGPSLEQITVAVGSGLTAPADGAAQYDRDVAKQAKQLGLPGW